MIWNTWKQEALAAGERVVYLQLEREDAKKARLEAQKELRETRAKLRHARDALGADIKEHQACIRKVEALEAELQRCREDHSGFKSQCEPCKRVHRWLRRRLYAWALNSRWSNVPAKSGDSSDCGCDKKQKSLHHSTRGPEETKA